MDRETLRQLLLITPRDLREAEGTELKLFVISVILGVGFIVDLVFAALAPDRFSDADVITVVIGLVFFALYMYFVYQAKKLQRDRIWRR
jgi:hypothetical protein